MTTLTANQVQALFTAIYAGATGVLPSRSKQPQTIQNMVGGRLVKAGFLRRDKGRYFITEEGREALQSRYDFPVDREFAISRTTTV